MPEQQIYKIPGQQLSLSFVKPDFINEDLLEAPEKIYRMDSRGQRFYYKLDSSNNPTFGGSVTNIKDKVLGKPHGVINKRIEMGDHDFFQYVGNRQDYGTFFHIHAGMIASSGEFDFGDHGENLRDSIENYAASHDVDYTGPKFGKSSWFDEAWVGLLAWVQFLDDYDVTPLAVELPLFHPDGFANTIDLVCEMNAKKYTKKTAKKNRKRITAIVDVKTGYIYPEHAIQLAFNKRSFDYHYDFKIDKLINWSYKDWWSSPSYTNKDQTKTAAMEEKLLDSYLKIYKEKHHTKPSDIKIPTGKMAVGSDLSQNYQTIPVEQFIKDKHSEL